MGENYPGNCTDAEEVGPYYRKHNPFMSFTSIRNNQTRCQKIVNSSQFEVDIRQNKLPQYSFYSPNIDNDGHDTNITFASDYLLKKILPHFNSFASLNRTLIVITFDECRCFYEVLIHHTIPPLNHIATILMGGIIKPQRYKTSNENIFQHYSLLKTVLENWELDANRLGERLGSADVLPVV
eukprot:TRINITY_DN14694_c0_g1_i2.p1 TRINITY_DN14694_c0_g1~~TRINITY_DN14694_c0_g1_i2.p1  ORF type:complete len:191 (+),score=11.78 TRINITY_DN14694_c0_g1_i2:28-573(+)